MDTLDSLIDLHAHTNASDGTLTPTGLVEEAIRVGLKAVAITDHDTVAGLAEGMGAAEGQGVEVVPGLEISAKYNPGTMHILGLFISAEHARLKKVLKRLQVARAKRNPKILRRLGELGFPLEMKAVEAVTGDGQLGRPHIARAMLEAGYVRTMQEAFDRFLKKGAPAYVVKEQLSPPEAIGLIHEAGGLAILAHPGTLGISMGEQYLLLRELREAGLDGVEVHYSSHSRAEESFLSQLAEELDLAVSGGTDYHGFNRSGVALGTGRGDLHIPYSVLEVLKKRLG